MPAQPTYAAILAVVMGCAPKVESTPPPVEPSPAPTAPTLEVTADAQPETTDDPTAADPKPTAAHTQAVIVVPMHDAQWRPRLPVLPLHDLDETELQRSRECLEAHRLDDPEVNPHELMAGAACLREARQIGREVTLYRHMLQAHPQLPLTMEATRVLGLRLEQIDDRAGALQAFSAYLARYPKQEDARAVGKRSVCLARSIGDMTQEEFLLSQLERLYGRRGFERPATDALPRLCGEATPTAAECSIVGRSGEAHPERRTARRPGAIAASAERPSRPIRAPNDAEHRPGPPTAVECPSSGALGGPPGEVNRDAPRGDHSICGAATEAHTSPERRGASSRWHRDRLVSTARTAVGGTMVGARSALRQANRNHRESRLTELQAPHFEAARGQPCGKPTATIVSPGSPSSRPRTSRQRAVSLAASQPQPS
ncbi:MAG: hypothetical protein K0V04_28040 [Deltaproteobacteria bacterium]|nr:hypothetical protein [Deltaproteobacteria bacterium]